MDHNSTVKLWTIAIQGMCVILDLHVNLCFDFTKYIDIIHLEGWMNRKYQSFTLVELLVVIAIIIILAGLIMAVISRAKADAAKTVCLSNLRQLGEAELIYAQDYNGYFPPFLNTGTCQ